MDGRIHRFPLYSTGHCPFWGRCPRKDESLGKTRSISWDSGLAILARMNHSYLSLMDSLTYWQALAQTHEKTNTNDLPLIRMHRRRLGCNFRRSAFFCIVIWEERDPAARDFGWGTLPYWRPQRWRASAPRGHSRPRQASSLQRRNSDWVRSKENVFHRWYKKKEEVRPSITLV